MSATEFKGEKKHDNTVCGTCFVSLKGLEGKKGKELRTELWVLWGNRFYSVAPHSALFSLLLQDRFYKEPDSEALFVWQ